MKTQLSTLLFTLSLLSTVQAQSLTGEEWTGAYNGNINGAPATLTLRQKDNQVEGQINAGGYLYNLSGNINGQQSQGQLTDPQTQGIMTYQGQLQGNNLTLYLNANGSQFQIQFARGASAPAGVSSGGLHNTGQGAAVHPTQVDQQIVGNWLYTDSYTSGEFSFASQYRLIINPDGTYLYGDGKVAGGGPGVSGSSGGGGMTPGKWKTEGNIIYIDEGYGWQPYARYYVEGASMMFTFGDGKRQVWNRSY